MKKFTHAMITGATGGLGVEIVKILAPRCDNLILVGRKEDALRGLEALLIDQLYFKGKIQLICVDLSQKDSLLKLQHVSPVDLLINNAGLGFMNRFEKHTADEIHQMLMVNTYALTTICHHFAKLMLEKNKGQIINVSSVNCFFPVSLFSVYSASKAYVTNLSLALDTEFKTRGVRVKSFCPGGIRTTFHRKSGMSDNIIKAKAKFIETPEVTAKDLLKLIDSNSSIYVPKYYNRLIRFLSAILPPQVMAKSAKKMYEEFL